jgi:hypothetical protein
VVLPPEEKLYFILNALKQGTTQVEHGNKFGMTQTNVNKWFHLLHEVLHQTLGRADLVPARGAAALKARLRAALVKRDGGAGQASEAAAVVGEPGPKQLLARQSAGRREGVGPEPRSS